MLYKVTNEFGKCFRDYIIKDKSQKNIDKMARICKYIASETNSDLEPVETNMSWDKVLRIYLYLGEYSEDLRSISIFNRMLIYYLNQNLYFRFLLENEKNYSISNDGFFDSPTTSSFICGDSR